MNVAMIDAMRRARIVAACSFDVFDTFLLRACATPDGLFERVYELSRISEICPNVSESFVRRRIKAGQRTREGTNNLGDAREVHIADNYSRFAFKLFGLDRSALNDLADEALHAELELRRANPDIVQKTSETKRAGYDPPRGKVVIYTVMLTAPGEANMLVLQ
jgi:hypothetical protein